jgi:hypothetical protein
LLDEVIEKIRALKLIKNIRMHGKALTDNLTIGMITTYYFKVKSNRKP